MVCKSTRSTIKGHTNNPGGKDGLRSGMVVLNEIHQYQDYKNINVFTTGLGKKKHPRRSYYTTQGDVREGPLDDLLETAEGILFGGEPDNGLLPVYLPAGPARQRYTMKKNWEKANPSLPYLPTLMGEMRKRVQRLVSASGTSHCIYDKENEHPKRIHRHKSMFLRENKAHEQRNTGSVRMDMYLRN